LLHQALPAAWVTVERCCRLLVPGTIRAAVDTRASATSAKLSHLARFRESVPTHLLSARPTTCDARNVGGRTRPGGPT
jgi:hypothetical protein